MSTLISRIQSLQGNAPPSSPNTRTLAAFASHTECGLARLGFAAGVSFDKLLKGTSYQMPYGQSPFAFHRGNSFQDMVAENNYAHTMALLREKMGFQSTDARIRNLRVGFPGTKAGMGQRAAATRSIIQEIINEDPNAANLIDGAVLQARIGGVPANFEADALAARVGGLLHAGEIKSFPVVDDRADPQKLASALDQVAIYIWLLYELIAELGRDPSRLVSSVAMLITPKNVGLTPTLSIKDVSPRIIRFKRLLDNVPTIEDVVSSIPGDISFGPISDTKRPEPARVDELHRLADRVGIVYRPECLSSCGNARFCRERAFNASSPCVAGAQVVRLLPGAGSLQRAAALSKGAPAKTSEAPVAAYLSRAGRLYDEVEEPQ